MPLALGCEAMPVAHSKNIKTILAMSPRLFLASPLKPRVASKLRDFPFFSVSAPLRHDGAENAIQA